MTLLTQMVNFPTQIPGCHSHSPALLDMFLSSDANISKWDAPFHCIAYDYSHTDWDGLRDHLRDVP